MLRAWTSALLLGLALSASAQDRYKSADEAQRAIEAMHEEVKPLVEKLEGLRTHYPSAKSAAELEAGRAELRNALEEQRKRMGEATEVFNSLRKLEHTQGLQAVLGKGKTNLSAQIVHAVELEAFYKLNQEFRGRVGKALEEDAEAFARALEALEQGLFIRRLVLGLFGAVIFVLGVLAFKLWRGRMKAQTPQPSPMNSAAAASLPAAPVPPQALAGPPSAPALSQAAITAPAAASGSGLLGGNFQVIRELGSGGMGKVYEATDLTLQRKVAIKKLREELQQSPKELERFLAETSRVAALRHPGIAKIHGIVRDGGRICLVLEHVGGTSLRGFLDRHGRLQPRGVQGLLAHLASALDYAYGCGILHGGLKPSNILVTEERMVKLTDFGLAHLARSAASRITGAAEGATAYMAPEQELGVVSRESDLYSLGICVYETAVGSMPFTGPNFLAQKRELYYAPPSAAAGLPPAFDAFMAKALQPDPAKRFHSASEMLKALPV